jgi:hypothetical protein
MPVIYIDDGSPDSREYDNNYLYYDEDDLERMQAILAFLDRRAARGIRPMTAERRALVNAIERHKRSAAGKDSVGGREDRVGRSPYGVLHRAVGSFLRAAFPGEPSANQGTMVGDVC